MINSPQTNLTVITSILLVTILTFFGCALVQVQNVNVRDTSSYKFSTSNNGLKVSIDPYFDKERLEKYFGADLLKRGVLPVLLVFENTSAEDGFILLREQSGLVMKQLADDRQKTNDNVSQAARNVQMFNSILPASIVITPLATLAILPFALAAENNLKNEQIIARNINEKSIVDKTVYPGGSHNGFLYFKLNSKEDIAKIEGVQLNLKNIRTNEKINFVINIKSFNGG